nr:cathepsin L [Hymenolepis microstoma]
MPLPKVNKWLDWCKKYNMSFDSAAENIYRHSVWLKNYEMIQRHNSLNTSTYKMGFNQFSYMEHWEFVEMNLRRRGVIKDNNEPDTPETTLPLPDIATTTAGNCLSNNFDWRDKFPSISARDQSSCGACWAFASSAVLEWHWAIHEGHALAVSPQQLVDCVRASHGCSGGLIEHALYYAQKHGLASELDYPYKSRVTQCMENSTRVAVKIRGYATLLEMDENALACVVQRIGPVAIAFDFSGAGLQHYESGIYDGTDCSTELLNHAMVLVGFGTDPKGNKYWIAQNSFSQNWGENGFFRLKFGVNLCGINSDPVLPIV